MWFWVQFEMNLYKWIFQKTDNLLHFALCNVSFLKNTQVHIPNWTRKPNITYMH